MKQYTVYVMPESKIYLDLESLHVRIDQEPRIYFLIIVGALIWYSFGPADYKVWFLEALPVLGAWMFLLKDKFLATPLLYRGLFVQSLVLILSAHYTYPKVPVGAFFQTLFELSNNPFDRTSFVLHGVVSAIFTLEFFKRFDSTKPGTWLPFSAFLLAFCSSMYYKKVESSVQLHLGDEEENDFFPREATNSRHADLQLTFFSCSCAILFLQSCHDREWKNLAERIFTITVSDRLADLMTEIALKGTCGQKLDDLEAWLKKFEFDMCPAFREHLIRSARETARKRTQFNAPSEQEPDSTAGPEPGGATGRARKQNGQKSKGRTR